MPHSVIVGIQRPDGTRVDCPDSNGEQHPVMLQLGSGLAGAPSWPTEGETQVLIQATNSLTISGNGIESPCTITSLVIGDRLSAVCVPGSNTATIQADVTKILVAGSGFPQPIPVPLITFNSNMSVQYDPDTGGAVVNAAGGDNALPIGSVNTVYCSNGSTNFWSNFPTVNGVSTQTMVVRPESSGKNHTVRQADDRIVDYTSSLGGTIGSYAVSARPYDNSSSAAPRHAKLFGSFSLVGQNQLKVLQFPSAIDGASMPANSALTGKFLLGWKGTQSGNPYVAGAIEFLFIVTTDASGNLHRFRTALSELEATPSTSYTFSLDANSLDTSMSVKSPTNAHLPCAVAIAIAGSEFWLEFGTYEGPNVQPTDVSKFYWECSYGWGTT